MRGGSIFVLTVDDDVAFARAAARSFESVGMRTFLALDPGAPFDGSEPIDVIVTDRAGEPRCLALAQMIKNRGPRGPIILMTAHGTSETAIEATKFGAFDYLMKPFDMEELLNMGGGVGDEHAANASVEFQGKMEP